MRKDPDLWEGAKAYYRKYPEAFINHWVDTYDPRNAGTALPARLPLVLFERQDELIQFLKSCIEAETGGLVEKARDMGATWICVGFSVWIWLFWPGAAVGWGSRKEQLVDRLGDPDSIFEKMRTVIRNLPQEFLPAGFKEKEHMTYMRIVNPENGATITGEAGNNIGRGGRKLIYFKDESAHYERPELIEAALGDNTRVQIDISSVNGLGNVFHRKRESGVEWEPGKPANPNKVNVFVMDWRDHPAKTDEWYLKRKKQAEEAGLLHIFAQEVERNYASSVEGIIIKIEWILAAVDAHKKLGFEATGMHVGGMDIADEGGDKNAFARRQGPMLLAAEDWGEGDTGQSTRRVIGNCVDFGVPVEIQYDSVGVGAGVKAEANRLIETGEMPKFIRFVAWNAAAGVLDPDEHLVPEDEQTPLNKDFYYNLKAQAWWQLRLRFERTYKAIMEGIPYEPDELISLPSTLPRLAQIQKELGQATASRTAAALKLVVNKTPEGTRSPNLADAIVMAYWPANLERFVFVTPDMLKRAARERRR